MLTVKMYQLERNLGQLCDRNCKRYGGLPCLQIKLAYMMHLSEIVVVSFTHLPCRVGSVGSVSASRTVGREFASRPGHTKDHHKNGTNCLPA